VVQQAGGAIHVESTEGVGSTFRVYIPIVDGIDHIETEIDDETDLSGSETILLAEDEPAVRKRVKRLLERAGYTVIDAENGQAALDRIDDLADMRALVTDVVMPRVDGIELARRLRERWRDLPVLYLSGYSEEQRSESSEPPPRGVFLRKPFGSQQLLGRLRELLDEANASHPAG
jgi:two-component system cell cycle sensor histidine kinase/response regulator CckA